jgi:hypothetical protein
VEKKILLLYIPAEVEPCECIRVRVVRVAHEEIHLRIPTRRVVVVVSSRDTAMPRVRHARHPNQDRLTVR